MKKTRFPRSASAFTLIELLVVISIIAVLAGLTFSGVQTAMIAAKKVQAKNDMMQLANAVTSYYTEYGKYPSGASTSGSVDLAFGTASSANNLIVSVLRYAGPTGWTDSNSENARQIQFLQPKVLDASTSNTKGAVNKSDGNWYDPWGVQYVLFEDLDYDGSITVKTQFSDFTDNPNFGVGTASVGYYYALQKSKTQTIGSGLSVKTVDGKKSILLSWQ
jgi:prepilin-type N-terminal cleavage/methylation domain-containing protein